jgi:hypothetical protein
MADKPQEPTQTTPKGVEIPVPKRDDFLRDLKKVAPPAKPERGKPSKT